MYINNPCNIDDYFSFNYGHESIINYFMKISFSMYSQFSFFFEVIEIIINFLTHFR